MSQHLISTDLVVSTDRRFLSRDAATAELLSIVGVDPQWSQYVRVLDRQGPLVLLHYINTWVSTDDHTINEEPLKAVGHVRGTIVNTNTGKIVCRSYPYTPDVVSNDPARIHDLIPEELNRVLVYNACEGTVLRVFWAGDRWNISTHRKIDAHNSYWNGPTFGSMFDELCEGNFTFDDLDQKLCYVFLMSHNDNRLVYKVSKPQLMLITIYSQADNRFLTPTEYGTSFESKMLNPPGCVYPVPVENINTFVDLQKTVDEMEGDASYNRAGLIIISDPTNPRPVKVVNAAYNSVRNARGNEPSLRSRYIHLRGSPEGGLLVQWFNEPLYSEVFDGAEKEIDALVTRLHNMYVNRYVNKDFSTLPKEEFVTLQRCHGWHTTDRANNIVTATKVREFLNTTPTHFLLVMLNRQRREQRETDTETD